jgi:hypothetical protein
MMDLMTPHVRFQVDAFRERESNDLPLLSVTI